MVKNIFKKEKAEKETEVEVQEDEIKIEEDQTKTEEKWFDPELRNVSWKSN